MAKQLIAQPLPNFGVNGLNTQSNPNSLDPSYLTSADNIVLRESGRISLRKGLKQKVVPSGTTINSIVEHNDQGTNKIFASYGTSIYRVDFTTPQSAFPTTDIDVQHTVSGSSGDWQFVNFNNRLHCFHSGVVPQRYDGASDALERWSAHYNTTAINLADGGSITAPNVVSGSSYKITALGNTNFELLGADSTPAVDEIFTATSAGSSAVGSTITAPNIVSGKSYKIIALGNTDFELLGGDSDPAVGEVFTATSNGEDGIAGSAITAPNIVEGKRYKIITTGSTNFTLVGADDSDVDTIFTANSTAGLGTGTVKEVTIGTTGTIAEAISGTTGTITEIKTNPSLTTITADDTTNFPSTGKIIIDEEIISYTGKTSTTFTGCIRGSSNTTATYHLDNAVVKNNFSPLSVTEGEFKPSCGTGAYGRIWAGGVEEEKDVLHYSSILDGDDFTLYSGGGSIDLKKVWDKDDIIAIAPFYGQLAVFGKNNIALYESPDVIGNIKLNEVIKGIGCVARDSVQAIGDDLVFLSNTGLRSLARTSEKDKVPLTDISKNIKDTLIRNIGVSDLTKVKSVYVENEGMYILSFTDKNINYVFDFKHFTPNGEPRVTTWTFDGDREPASMIYTELYSGLLVGQKDGGIAGYEGYFDKDYGITIAAATFLPIPEATPPIHSTTEKKIGASSIYFSDVDGFIPNMHLRMDAAKLGKGTGDFTVEGWFKPTNEAESTDSRWDTIPSGYEMTLWTWGRKSSNVPKTKFYYNDNEFKFYYNGSTYNTLTGSAHGLTGDSWAHLAVTKSGSTITIWVNGVSKGSTTTDTDIDFTENEFIGYYPYEAMLCADHAGGSSQGFTGYIDEVRFSKVARYTTGFTPSTTAFEKDEDTLILIHSDESTSGSSTFVDSSESQVNFSYSTDISSPWLGLGETMADSILKKAHFVLEGGSGSTLGLKIYKDFGTDANKYSINLSPTSTGTTSLWGEALYGTSKYSPIYGLQEYRKNLSGSAKHLKINMAIDSQGYDVSLQDLSILHKQGKIR
jgi:hypothetical protein